VQKTIVYNQEKSERIDKYIHSLNSDVSRRFFQNSIKEGFVLVNKNQVSPSYKLKKNDQIKIDIKKTPKVDFEIKPEKSVEFKVVAEYEDFLIINKPAGISVHPCENEPGNTLVNGLLCNFPEIKNAGENKWRPGIVHRLDKETSGVLVVVKTKKAFDYFKALFKNREIQKTYLAWSWGNPKNDSGMIKDFTGKSKQNPTKQAVSANPEKLINPKQALTEYKVIKKLKDKSLIELQPKTGRKHQLRLHLHSIGHPILGDKKYSNKTIRKFNEGIERHLLHAQKIEFKYLDGQEYKFETPLPGDMRLIY